MSDKINLVGKIGSMALIREGEGDIDYNIFSRLGRELKPGMVWVSSGATEIGRLDHINRNGEEISGDEEETKSDYASQGQSILMENYRKFISPKYSVRQLLVEHTHFNDEEKREHIRKFLHRCPKQNAVPIINYNDPVSYYENRRREISLMKNKGAAPVECVDNDETASVICSLVNAPVLLILTSVYGIYATPGDSSTLIEEIVAPDKKSLEEKVKQIQKACVGASRKGAGGAFAKLEYVLNPAMNGTRVLIGNAKYNINDILSGTVPSTRIEII
ncbi:MAG: uridylate kinase [Eubacteriales bacterium]